ncbi:DUF7710 domain-containing protein [Gimesia alba]|uniref:DUF7710 domain-containing protein n=1 Tax=Gimesia alba TaxID=2527973 RepID=UPI001E64688A|nr:hypothetical protein [Gimesia alba]
MLQEEKHTMWVFHGASAQFAIGVFSSREKAETWINRHQLIGVLTRYPVDTGVYDWAIETGMFSPQKEYQTGAKFIGRFTSASQEHFHYESGIEEGGG